MLPESANLSLQAVIQSKLKADEALLCIGKLHQPPIWPIFALIVLALIGGIINLPHTKEAFMLLFSVCLMPIFAIHWHLRHRPHSFALTNKTLLFFTFNDGVWKPGQIIQLDTLTKCFVDGRSGYLVLKTKLISHHLNVDSPTTLQELIERHLSKSETSFLGKKPQGEPLLFRETPLP